MKIINLIHYVSKALLKQSLDCGSLNGKQLSHYLNFKESCNLKENSLFLREYVAGPW